MGLQLSQKSLTLNGVVFQMCSRNSFSKQWLLRTYFFLWQRRSKESQTKTMQAPVKPPSHAPFIRLGTISHMVKPQISIEEKFTPPILGGGTLLQRRSESQTQPLICFRRCRKMFRCVSNLTLLSSFSVSPLPALFPSLLLPKSPLVVSLIMLHTQRHNLTSHFNEHQVQQSQSVLYMIISTGLHHILQAISRNFQQFMQLQQFQILSSKSSLIAFLKHHWSPKCPPSTLSICYRQNYVPSKFTC